MIFSLLASATLALSTPALADERVVPAPEAKIYVSARASAGFPASYPETTTGFGLELGGIFKDHNAIGLRALILPNPPAIYGPDTPDVAFGPALTWSYLAPIGSRLDLYPTATLGFGVGKSPQDGANEILPSIQGGLGARIHFAQTGGSEIFVAPELGFVPLLLAPYVVINIGTAFSANR